MKIHDKIERRLDALEFALKNQEHISEPDKVLEIIASITKFWTVLGDEDRDYVNAARFALEEQRPWTP
ncbi:hypothetical protein [Sulfitobacter mediterraneus]|uniref:Uncharacterized protein n=1 Tax=Sulfitobacter mediterraneus TaxID=83219 RepID=A0A2T6C0R2_9RHOB|nr:hypothetical protein [Sulfitobacter mediterraneus]KIN75683.1 hypothetical protein Z950_2554 [Sulfitobacter mediterraneus KCTC 32188]PTX61900.1 hypothetical protein C8N31_12021 [Sulfitobacter mediterraneus]